jgi:hypothetical protein
MNKVPGVVCAIGLHCGFAMRDGARRVFFEELVRWKAVIDRAGIKLEP